MTAVSPCIGVCRIDPDTQLCEGCRRSLTENAEWPACSEDRRRAILAALPSRASSAPRAAPDSPLRP